MFQNYLKIAIRTFLRHKTHGLINIAGLTVGIACCALILLYIRDELSHDRFHQKADRIFALTARIEIGEQAGETYSMAAPIGPAFEADYPEVIAAVRLQKPYGMTLVRVADKHFYEENLYTADPHIFSVFDFSLESGDPATALQNFNSVVLSRAAARKYFGSENPMGRTIEIERGEGVFVVTGILDDIPKNSSIRPDFLISIHNIGGSQLQNWWGFSFPTFLLLEDKVSATALRSKLLAFVDRYYGNAPPGFANLSFGLQALPEMHLRSVQVELGKLNPMTYIYLFSALALFILAVACINFMNLATARSQHRAREVGVRKVVGSRRTQLILQFLVESMFLAFVAVIGSLFLIEFFLPFFNNLAQKNLGINYASDSVLIIGFFLLTLITGLLAGSYPAFFLSRFHPIYVLKGGTGKSAPGARLRSFLVVGQFVLSVALIVSTLVVREQVEFIRNKELGFDQEQVLVVPLRGDHARNNWGRLKHAVLQNANIIGASASSGMPADQNMWITGARRKDTGLEKDIYTYQIDYDFFNTLKIQLAGGRFLSSAFPSDSVDAFVLNETAAKEFGWESAEAAIGQPFVWLGQGPDNPKTGRIVGVVKDFHFRPLYEKIAPAVFHLMPGGKSLFFMRFRPNSIEKALAVVREEWETFDPLHPLEYSFLDEKVNIQYGAEIRLRKIFSVFSAFAIFISSLGLFGLVSFTAERRTKEIGIRKVLGATVSHITGLLSMDFLKLVIVANVIAWPVAWYAMNKWLDNFAYRIEISWWTFAMAGGLALLIALLTVCTQAIRAALANPVESLRYE